MGRLFLRGVPTLHTMRAPTRLQNLLPVLVTAAVVSSHLSVCLGFYVRPDTARLGHVRSRLTVLVLSSK